MAIAGLMLGRFEDAGLEEGDLLARLAWLRDVVGPRLERYMGYYRNPMTELAGVLPCAPSTRFMVRPFRQYQEIGLPARITGFRRAADGSAGATGPVDVQRKEVVIENDIAWRINAQVDFAANRLPAISSKAQDEVQRARLTAVIQAILATAGMNCGATNQGWSGAAGWAGALQQLVLQGAINGSAWVHIRPSDELLGRLTYAADGAIGGEDLTEGLGEIVLPDMGRWLRLEILETGRVCPLPWKEANACSAQEMTPAYVAVLRGGAGGRENFKSQISDFQNTGLIQRVRSWFGRPGVGAAGAGAEEFSFDLFGAHHWQRYEDGVLMAEGENGLEVVPFVRYENASDPAAGTRVGPAGSGAVDVGIGDVEPLIGMQDELNTRLSDRAFRVTMTSFRMYLGKGIEDFIKRPIGPGQMWGTDNQDASIESFGGDGPTPSEDSHIEEVREAMDKISGVPPVAAGILRAKLGNLTSAIALKITLIAMLSRTDRKRAALERTMGTVVRMALEILDRAGVVKSEPADRGIAVNWFSALPENDMDKLTEAQTKLALGIPREVVLGELGYGGVVMAEEGERASEKADAGNRVAE